MSKIRNASTAAVASLALGAGIAASAGVAPAQASTNCTAVSVYCSMAHARNTVAGLSYGRTGYQVRELQRSLRSVSITASVTGRYDAQTRTAVKRYQYTRKIAQTGVLDGRTLAYLRHGASARRSTTSTTVVSSTGVSATARLAVSYAYSKLGKPYVYGATGPNSFDCSGLTYAAYRAAGKSIPRTSYAQLAGLTRVSISSLRPGDIVGYYGGGHVGIYIGNGIVIHAPHTGTVVKKAALRSMPITWAVRPA